jgi:hypothetical protein
MPDTTTSFDVRQLFDTYAATFATCDPDAIVALHAPGTRFWLHTGGGPVDGRAAVRKTFAGFFEQWPELGFDVYRVITGPRHWVLDWALTAVLNGPDRTRRPIRFDCLDLVTLDDDGLVDRKDTFIDVVQAQAALRGDGAPDARQST